MKPTPDMINLALSFLADIVLEDGILDGLKSQIEMVEHPSFGPPVQRASIVLTFRVIVPPAAGRAPKYERLEAAGLKLMAKARELELDAAQKGHPK